jgi:glycosyltransferase involved in cell wall biosynthesis
MTNRFNILLTNASDIYGGGEFYVCELANELQKRGHDVRVSCKPDNLLLEKCRQSNIKTIPLDFPPKGQLLKFVSLLRRMTKENDIQIIHTNTNYDRTAGAFAARLAGAVHITNVHSFQSIQHNLTHWLRNKKATDHFLVDGECVKDLLTAQDSIPAGKISVVHLGVNPETMKRDERHRSAIRNEFHFTKDHIVIGNVARLVPFKGQEYLLNALALVAKQHPNIRLLLVGDGVLRQDFKYLVQSLQIEPYVAFAGFRDDLPAVYSAFDMYVHPSIEGGGETFPFAVLQALAQELPVIVTRVGDVPAMVDEGGNGYIVAERNPEIIAERINSLVNDPILLKQMAQRSRERLLKYFTTRNMVDVVESLYTSLISGRKLT